MTFWKPPILGVGSVALKDEHANVMFVCVETGDNKRTPIGTAVRVGLPGSDGRAWKYYVTAAHLVGDECPTWIRFRRRDGGFTDEPIDRWYSHKTADVAATPCDVDVTGLLARWAPDSLFADRWDWAKYGPIYEGIQAHFVGLVHDPSVLRNRAVQMIRSGRIGALGVRDVPMQAGDIRLIEPVAHLMDSFSRGGFSGAPVFVEYPLVKQTPVGLPYVTGELALLGILIGHFGGLGDNTGIAVVTPIEAVRELLTEREELVTWHEAKDKAAQERDEKDQWEGAGTLDSAMTESEYDRFEDLAKKLVQVPKSELDAERKSDEGSR